MNNKEATKILKYVRAGSYQLYPSDQLDDIQLALRIASMRIEYGDPVLRAFEELVKENPNRKFSMQHSNFDLKNFLNELKENSQLGDGFRKMLDKGKIEDVAKVEAKRQIEELLSDIQDGDKLFYKD